MAALERHLGTAMGIRLSLLERLTGSRNAVPLALAWLLLQGAGAALALWWTNGERPPDGGHAKLASLIVWQALHFPVLVALTRLLTVRVLDIVECDILPFASARFAACVEADLARQSASLPLRLAPYAVAVLATAASLWTMHGEIAPVRWAWAETPPDLLFWTAANLVLAVLEMRVVLAATFPRAFAAALDRDRESIYPLRAVDSPLVRGLARLNRALLGYWAAVFVVWASVLLLVLAPPSYALARDSAYILVIVPFVGLFSLGLGAFVYLSCESRIATVLRRDSLERAQELQGKIAALLDRPDEDSAAQVERLSRLHDRIIDGARYGSNVGKAASLVLPLILPAISIMERLFGGRGG